MLLLCEQDAEFEMVDIDLTPEQSALYTTCSQLFFDLRRALATAISRTGLDGHQSPMKLFWWEAKARHLPCQAAVMVMARVWLLFIRSVQQRFFRDLINSFKVCDDRRLAWLGGTRGPA